MRLFDPAEPVDTVVERRADRRTATQRSPVQVSLGWQQTGPEVKDNDLLTIFIYCCTNNPILHKWMEMDGYMCIIKDSL